MSLSMKLAHNRGSGLHMLFRLLVNEYIEFFRDTCKTVKNVFPSKALRHQEALFLPQGLSNLEYDRCKILF